MRRGYIRHVRLWPGAKQEALLRAASIKDRVTYRDDDWPGLLKSLRAGDVVVLGGGLRVLGDSRQDITARVVEVRRKGAAIEDAETGRTAADDGAELMSEAIARIAGEKRMPDRNRAVEMQRASVAARLKAKKQNRMPRREALAIWRDAQYTVAEAVALMIGWTQAAGYRELGPRGIPAGPRGKKAT